MADECQHAPKSTDATAAPLMDTEKAVPTLRDWPTSPKAVQHSPWVALSNIVFDLLLFACAVAFLAFASVVSSYDKASTADNPRTTKMLLSATKYGPTVFPILFALVLGRATHAILRWRLERGECIGILDTLAASTSFTNTVVSQFQLRTVSSLGVALVSLWALSPIGGQASLRQMTIATSNVTTLATFDYLAYSGDLASFLNTDRNSTYAIIDTIFMISMATPTVSRSSPFDAGGNVRIPRVEYYEARTNPDDDGWYNSGSGDTDSYASLIGIPISEANSVGFTDFQTRIQTSYLETSCSLATLDASQERNSLLPNGFTNYTGSGALIFFNDTTHSSRPRVNPQNLEPFQFQYRTKMWKQDNYQMNCTLTSSYVETEIVCPQSTSCAATRVRRSRWASPPAAWTLLDRFSAGHDLLFDGFINSAGGREESPTLLDRYLKNPALANKSSSGGFKPVFSTTEREYSVRMSQLLNSYNTCLNGILNISGGLKNDTAYHWDTNASFVPPQRPVDSAGDTFFTPVSNASEMRGRTWTAEGTKTASTEVIVAHMPWVVTLYITSIVLILSSLVSPLAHSFLIRGPELMMNISSLATRHNSYIPLPEGGTHLDASDRARLLQTVKIRFGDNEKSSNVGHLVIGNLECAYEQDITRVRKGRLYE